MGQWLWSRRKPLQLAQLSCFFLWCLTMIGAAMPPSSSVIGSWCQAYWWVGFWLMSLAVLAIRAIDALLGCRD